MLVVDVDDLRLHAPPIRRLRRGEKSSASPTVPAHVHRR
jgi:hypothetical protein